MGATNTEHGKLVSGLQIWAAKRVNGTLRPVVGPGTLTGLATRDSDGTKVLVTNLHVMTGTGRVNPSGGEEMYHESVSANKKVGTVPVWDSNSPAWIPMVFGQGKTNVADVAICTLESGVDAEFAMHDSTDHSGASRKIIEGVVEPKKGMQLTVLSAAGGEGTVTVRDIGDNEKIRDRNFVGLVTINAGQRLLQPGPLAFVGAMTPVLPRAPRVD